MKKTLTTIATAAGIVLITTGFAIAEAASANIDAFPYFQMGCLVVGGLVITSLKEKFEKLYISEAIGAFAIYAIFVSLFTNPVIDMIKNIVS